MDSESRKHIEKSKAVLLNQWGLTLCLMSLHFATGVLIHTFYFDIHRSLLRTIHQVDV